MLRDLSQLFISCCLFILTFSSCNQTEPEKHAGNTDEQTLNKLISRDKEYLNSHIDSLLTGAKVLANIAAGSGNKTALIYSELFNAQYYWLTSDHKKSMELALKCRADAEKWDIRRAYPTIYTLMGNLHKENANFNLAFDAAQKGLYYARENKDTLAVIGLIGLKAMFIHTENEARHFALNDTSINLQLSALKIAESNPKFEPLRITFYDNISQYYLDNKNYKNAIYYGDKGVALALKYNRQRSLTYGYSWLGEAYFYSGERKKGLDYLNKAMLIARQLKQPYRVMEIYGHLYDCYYSAGDYKKAIDLNRVSQSMHDSLQVNINEKQVSELQIKYESAKKDQEIALMGHAKRVYNRQLLAIIAFSLLLVIFFIVLFLQYRIIRRHNSKITTSNEMKDQALADIAFIQTHEIRKPLASIMGLINVIKSMDSNELDNECLVKLDEASKELDERIHDVIAHITKAK